MTSPAAYVTVHRHATTDRTRLRVTVVDDGSLPRVHITAVTSAGDIDIALTSDAAMQLGDALHEQAANAADWWMPEKVDYQPRLEVVQ
jgi:hypothetical protein